ncbi:MAG: HU family DNA-binding protein [Anaerolineae bacterium]|jgi:nucleoid DNA-binding protein|nr:HU family DNA-binding protein [Anaerolineae bacterium]
MTHKATIRAVARRFPALTQREIEEVLQVFIEVWQDQLEDKHRVTIHGFGSLSVELQDLQTRGAVRKPTKRLYVRFRPTQALKSRLKEARR